MVGEVGMGARLCIIQPDVAGDGGGVVLSPFIFKSLAVLVEELLARLRVTQRRLSQMQAENGVQSAVFENGALRIEYAAGPGWRRKTGYTFRPE